MRSIFLLWNRTQDQQALLDYIDRQEEHHRKGTFQEESLEEEGRCV